MDNGHIVKELNYASVLKLLPGNVHSWVQQLSEQQLANELITMYSLHTTKIKPLDTAAANIGKIGEIGFANALSGLPNNYTLVDTTKVGHAGDFIIEKNVNGRVF